jgi:hypothetical protein
VALVEVGDFEGAQRLARCAQSMRGSDHDEHGTRIPLSKL